MSIIEAREEYMQAMKKGLRECKELAAKGKDPHPAVLESFLDESRWDGTVDVGLVNIPVERIVGTKSAGRITAFSASFLPCLEPDTEFAAKWIKLCQAHLSDEGIRDPILCYEYMGRFYVQEGNKRLSVLRHFDAPLIPGNVIRILPKESEDPSLEAYREFLEFYAGARIYDIQFRRPGDYGKLLSHLGKELSEPWTEREQRTFRAYYSYFSQAFLELKPAELDLLPEEALLLWLKVYSFRDLGNMSGGDIKRSLRAMRESLSVIAEEEPVEVRTEPSEENRGFFSMLLNTAPDHVNVAFVQQRDVATSGWTKGHEEGAAYLEKALGEAVTVRRYFHADTPEEADRLLEQAVEEGAQVVFTTTPQLNRATFRCALKYPRVRFLNCSVDTPYSAIRTYYCRIYEAKFITGAIAGAMANNDKIGYIGSYPIFGVPASINAFALGAQMTNPRARIQLRWSCMEGDPVRELKELGVQVVSNRDVPSPDQKYLHFGDYGTYEILPDGGMHPLGSPCWLWGKFYETVVRSVLSGSWDQDREAGKAINYWWGMDSGVIDVTLAEHLPEGIHMLADFIKDGFRRAAFDPFRRRLVAQDGRVINDGSRILSADEILHMDWLCENVDGIIPEFDQVLEFSRATVRELGVYRDRIPPEKEGAL